MLYLSHKDHRLGSAFPNGQFLLFSVTGSQQPIEMFFGNWAETNETWSSSNLRCPNTYRVTVAPGVLLIPSTNNVLLQALLWWSLFGAFPQVSVRRLDKRAYNLSSQRISPIRKSVAPPLQVLLVQLSSSPSTVGSIYPSTVLWIPMKTAVVILQLWRSDQSGMMEGPYGFACARHRLRLKNIF